MPGNVPFNYISHQLIHDKVYYTRRYYIGIYNEPKTETRWAGAKGSGFWKESWKQARVWRIIFVNSSAGWGRSCWEYWSWCTVNIAETGSISRSSNKAVAWVRVVFIQIQIRCQWVRLVVISTPSDRSRELETFEKVSLAWNIRSSLFESCTCIFNWFLPLQFMYCTCASTTANWGEPCW